MDIGKVTGLSETLGEHIVECGGGRARVELPVVPKVQNPVGALHGGALASLIDSAGTLAIMAAPSNPDRKPGATTDLNVSYLAPAREGVVTAVARATKVGRRLAFAEIEVTRSDGVIVALGRITKFMAE